MKIALAALALLTAAIALPAAAADCAPQRKHGMIVCKSPAKTWTLSAKACECGRGALIKQTHGQRQVRSEILVRAKDVPKSCEIKHYFRKGQRPLSQYSTHPMFDKLCAAGKK